MKWIALLATIICITACTTTDHNAARSNVERQAALARGHEIAQAHCASCHAVGRSGDSTAPEAPPFRTLSQHYRVDTLEEALAEGISVGHPAMPEFQFAPDDVHALVLYLQSVQDDQHRLERDRN
jgi:mono/diheme cytochrome c family protein